MRSPISTIASCLILAAAAAGCGTVLSTSAPASARETVEAEGGASGSKSPGHAAFVDRSVYSSAFRRITESRYRNAVRDTFGPDVAVNARFEPERREDGLQAIGNAHLSITTTGLEQYIALARSISDQVVDGAARDQVIGCTPAGDAADAACVERFLARSGQGLFRRPLSTGEIERAMEIWRAGAAPPGDFHRGLKLALSSLLTAPEFLFTEERVEADPDNPGKLRLDAYTKAARLAQVLWDSAPDAELLEAARVGELHDAGGVSRQVDRMLASPRLADGVRAFFTDLLHFESFETLTKDPSTYPRFSQVVADSAREETMRMVVEHLLTKDGDYRGLFTTQDTVINRTLAAIYGVPYPSAAPWTTYRFAPEAERSGLLTQVTFLALFSHPAQSSPTVRGVRLHEMFLCVKVPDPPPDVDFSKVQATMGGTVRTRLIDHMTNPGCSTCHRISDPAGLTLERFDGLGQHRTKENGQLIDVSAEIGGRAFQGAQGLGAYLYDHPAVPACLVRQMHFYGQGRPIDYSEMSYLNKQVEAFAAGGYQIRTLYRNLATSPEFFRVVEPKGLLAQHGGDLRATAAASTSTGD